MLVSGQFVTVAGHDLMVRVSVVKYVEVEVYGVGVAEETSETGQTVVYKAMVSVVRAVE